MTNKIFRCTRNQPYRSEDAHFGHPDLTCRQGYYVAAENEEKAIGQMQIRFPSDRDGFTVMFWFEGINS